MGAAAEELAAAFEMQHDERQEYETTEGRPDKKKASNRRTATLRGVARSRGPSANE